ncbi:hypothetical protein HY386_01935 [Candidatus Daviesbacteria bacterium]|nr:hypothetical protein [Candidatus Daviesbacteria bacterium]
MAEKLRHILSPIDFPKAWLEEEFLKEAASMARLGRQGSNALRGKNILGWFFDPSVITVISFRTAVERLGGRFIEEGSALTTTGVTSEQALQDAVKNLEDNSDIDCLVLRYHQTGGVIVAAAVANRIRMINAGEGRQDLSHQAVPHHPTQFLADFLTIQHHFPDLNDWKNLRILVAGDLQWDRVNSLVMGLAQFRVRFDFISSAVLPLDNRVVSYLRDLGVRFTTDRTLKGLLPQVDIVYLTKQRTFRGGNHNLTYGVNVEVGPQEIDRMKEGAIVMHPMPRGEELSPETDDYPRIVWREQAKNGTIARMALLRMLLTSSTDRCY